MTNKIEELEKEKIIEIEKKFKLKVLNVNNLKKEQIILTDTYGWRDFREAIKISLKEGIEIGQQETLTEVEKMIDETDKKVCDLLDKHIHVIDDCDCCEKNVRNVTECLKLLEELKSKLQEMKK